jgi:hypothetical protein
MAGWWVLLMASLKVEMKESTMVYSTDDRKELKTEQY